MENSQGQLEAHSWHHAGYQGVASVRTSDIITVLGGLKQEAEGVENEIQKVEAELLADPENKVLNRKFERLLEEKRNKEGRRERLELQLTAPADHLFSAGPHGQGVLAHQPELQLHPYYQAGLKRPREEVQQEYANLQGYMHSVAEGVPPQQDPQQPPKGTGRGGKGGHKFCKRCKERITFGHQQKCKYCRKCYDENKELVLRAECPHGHDCGSPSSQSMLLTGMPLEQHQAQLEAQQHQLQLHMEAAGQAAMSHMPAGNLHLQHHMAMAHPLTHVPDGLQAAQEGHHAPDLHEEQYQASQSQHSEAHLHGLSPRQQPPVSGLPPPAREGDRGRKKDEFSADGIPASGSGTNNS